ncbi:hypothetical protein ANRL4_04754 [Anaerolineae bacterium]|nr:hypothetical protein ANRL4_04754 [Anaerolineae bacterium]
MLNRWLAFLVVLIGSAALILTQPPQTAFLFLVIFVVASLAVALYLSTRRDPQSAAVISSTDAPTEPPPSFRSQLQNFWARFSAGVLQIRWQRATAIAVSLGMMYVGQSVIYQDPKDYPTSGGWVMILVGFAMFFAALKGDFPPLTGPTTPVENQPTDAYRLRIRWWWLLISVGLVSFVSYRTILKPQEAHLSEHIILWILSMVALVMAFSPAESEPRRPNTHPLRLWEYGLIVVIFIFGMLFRATNLEGNPPLLDQDEAVFAREGATFPLERFLITPFEPGNHSHPRIYQAMIGVSNTIFGYTKEGARMPSAIMGALGMVALYLLGRELFGWQLALVAVLYAIPWFFHIQLSRLSMNQPGDPLFATFAFYYLLRGLRRRAPSDYALAGIFLGCAQLFYLGGRLAIPVMIAYVLFIWIRERSVITRQWRYLLIVPLGAFLITLPQNHYLLYFQQPFSTRAEPNILLGGHLQRVAEGGQDVGEYLLTQVKHSFLALFQIPDQSGWIGPGSNMLGIYGAPMLLIGAALSLILIWKRPRWSLPLGWGFSVILIGSTLSISPPQYQRYFPAVSAFSLLVAIGVGAVAYGIARVIQRPQAYLKIALVIGAILFATNAWFYYGVYVPENNFLQNRPNFATNATAREMVAATNAGRQVVVVNQFATGVENTLVVQYFMMGRKYYMYDDGLGDFRGDKPFTFIVAPERREDLDRIRMQFPGGRVRQVFLGEDGSLGFYVYERG